MRTAARITVVVLVAALLVVQPHLGWWVTFGLLTGLALGYDASERTHHHLPEGNHHGRPDHR